VDVGPRMRDPAAEEHAALRTPLSEQEYLDFERASSERHEYADGEIFAMSGGTFEHSLLIANFVGEARSALPDRRCRVLDSNMRVKVPATRRYVYPDASIVCGPPEFTDATQPDGSWTLRIYGPGERAALASVDGSIEVDRVYDGVLNAEA